MDTEHILGEIKERLSLKEWADEWGREMGVGGVTTKNGKWRAGDDDSLDAFRHAFVSAVISAWYEFFGGSQAISKDWSEFLGGLNEVANSKKNGTCSRAMDLHNNKVGRGLAPNRTSMIRWIMAGQNPHKHIAEIIASAVFANELIQNFNDPRMPKYCRTQAKIQGDYYIWRHIADGKARWDHSVREGQVFRWDTPPNGGHPGADYNCRCWAEPVQSNTNDDLDVFFDE